MPLSPRARRPARLTACPGPRGPRACLGRLAPREIGHSRREDHERDADRRQQEHRGGDERERQLMRREHGPLPEESIGGQRGDGKEHESRPGHHRRGSPGGQRERHHEGSHDEGGPDERVRPTRDDRRPRVSRPIHRALHSRPIHASSTRPSARLRQTPRTLAASRSDRLRPAPDGRSRVSDSVQGNDIIAPLAGR